MAFRIEEAALSLIVAVLPAFAAEFPARHEHLRKSCAGALTIDDRGVSFRETDSKRAKQHSWTWTYGDIQQLELSPKRLRILTYQDSRWRPGADRELTFTGDFAPAYPLFKDRLDQRFVAALPDADVKPLWEVPVKHLGFVRGAQGTLVVAEDRIVFKTEGQSGARTWRYKDIDNISTSGPFNLTLTTYERARFDYSNRREFNFQLKEPLDERRYNELWRKLHP